MKIYNEYIKYIMEEITKLIQNYNLPTSENVYQQTTQSNESYYTIDPPTTITNNNITPNQSQTSIFKKSYRKEIVIAKVIISELQEKINKKNIQIEELEKQLNEALDTITTLHKDYCTLTDRFSQVNQSINNINENEGKVKQLEEDKEKMKKEFDEQSEIYKINIEKLTEKMNDMQKHLEEVEEQLEKSKEETIDRGIVETLTKEKENLIHENYDLKNECINLKKSIQVDNKKMTLEIENLKNSVSLLESKNHTLNVEIKEKDIELQKQQKFIEQYNILDQQFSFSIKEKDKNYNLLNEQYTNLYNEYKIMKNQIEKSKEVYEDTINKLKGENESLMQKIKEYKLRLNTVNNYKQAVPVNKSFSSYSDEFAILSKQKEYIENLLFKTHPNGNLIKQIVQLHNEVLQLEVQKEKVEKQMEGNQNAKEIIYKIVSQINIFKSHLHKLEDDLSTEVLHAINTSFMTELSQ